MDTFAILLITLPLAVLFGIDLQDRIDIRSDLMKLWVRLRYNLEGPVRALKRREINNLIVVGGVWVYVKYDAERGEYIHVVNKDGYGAPMFVHKDSLTTCRDGAPEPCIIGEKRIKVALRNDPYAKDRPNTALGGVDSKKAMKNASKMTWEV